MVLITGISFHSADPESGHVAERAQVSILGLPFSADLTDAWMETVLRGVASQAGIEVDDYRKVGAE